MGERLTVRVCRNPKTLAEAAAEGVALVIERTVARKQWCNFVLAGGSTPRRLYELLGTKYHDAVLWRNVHFFWGDERYVPPGDPNSNYGMAKLALLDRLTIPAASINPMPTHFPDPDAAARDYEGLLRRHFTGEWPEFDLLLLGLGVDGHTASLFPVSPALDEQTRWVLATEAPAEPRVRLTLTLPAINHACQVFFLVAGQDKREVVSAVLREPERAVRRYPAARVRATDSVTWFLDEEAGSPRAS